MTLPVSPFSKQLLSLSRFCKTSLSVKEFPQTAVNNNIYLSRLGRGKMDIILQGQHNGAELIDSLERVFKLFEENYNIMAFREIHVTVTLVDEEGELVELVDSETNQAYRIFEVYRNEFELSGKQGVPFLQLVVDNTK